MYNRPFRPKTMTGICPEREEERINGLDRMATSIVAACVPFVRPRPSGLSWIVEGCGGHESSLKGMTDSEILSKARELGWSMRREGYRDELVAHTFALVREAAVRSLGLRHFDVQLIGGLALLKGLVAEMETGEGKTLTATLAASTAALAGEDVHIITVNDYLAARDAEWMRPIYERLGLTVGTVVHGISPDERRRAYGSHISYCTNKEVAFDYLRDRIVLWDRPGQARLQLERLYGSESRVNKLTMQGLHFAIVDEADSILVDEARTPLIISGDTDSKAEQALYREAFDAASGLLAGKDFSIIPEHRTLDLKEGAKEKIREYAWSGNTLWTTPEQREELVRQALVAKHLFDRDKHYLVSDGKVQIVDEYTGRVMPDRSWEQGLHQFMEAKEDVEMTTRKDTLARISYQRFFRRYLRLSGMTGTAREVAGELWSIYRLRVVTIPTNRRLIRDHLKGKIYGTQGEKWEAVVKEIVEVSEEGRPVLVGTRSVAASEHLSGLLAEAGLVHRVLNARQDKEEADIVARAGEQGCITVATNMAGRGTDIRLAQGIAERGGLHVIATERHEARRIDRQLSGRCARQGDPGTCREILSLDDELIRVYGGKQLQRFAKVLWKVYPKGMGSWIGRWMFRMALGSAQRLHARIRRNVLKMDERIGDALAFSGRQE